MFALLFFLLQQEPPPPESAHTIEEIVSDGAYWLKLVVEAMAALIIATGVFIAIFNTGRALILQQPVHFARNRLRLSRFLVFALELELAADILATGIAPSWDEIGKLGAIAVIRTGLNYFLGKEMKEQQEIVDRHTNEGLQSATPGAG